MYHPFESCGRILKEFLEETGRYSVEWSTDRDLLLGEALEGFDAVITYTQGGTLTPEQEEGLTGFVAGGGGFVGLHGATASWKTNDAYIDMLGGVFAGHGPVCDFSVTIVDHNALVTERVPDFRVTDELYLLDRFCPDAHVLATAVWEGEVQPIIYNKPYGEGRVHYNALGHDERTFTMPLYQKLVIRGLDWVLERCR
jgi:type 1 glutamine amidotransferase